MTDQAASVASRTATPERGAPRSWRERPVVWALALLVIYVLVSFLYDSGATMGADEGAKVATLKVMTERGSYSPDVGYWAAPWDHDGRYHGLAYTTRFGDSYINITTLPMLLLARPLWQLGGYRAALLLPMLGAVAAAFAARALALRVATRDRERAGRYAFWITGLASPVTIYALDLWEHAPGLAIMAWGVVFLYDASTRSVPGGPEPAMSGVAWRGLLGGALFGFAFTMRTEALVYVLTTVLLCVLRAGFPRRWWRPFALGASALVGFAALFVANTLLEVAVLGASYRSTRATGAASGAGADLMLRAQEAATTLVGVYPTTEWSYAIAGVALVLAVGVWSLAATRRIQRTPLVVGGVIAVVVLILAMRFRDGAGFWPGLLATTPFAAVGLFCAWTPSPRRWLLLLGLVPLPLVFAFQFSGGAVPQWGGRYILLTGFLLAVAGITCLTEMPQLARNGLIALAAIITLFGVVWGIQRTHDFAAAGDLLNRRPEAVLISPDGFPPREFGSTWGAKDWLSTLGAKELPQAVDVVRNAGVPSFAIVQLDPNQAVPDFPGYEEVGRSTIPLSGGATFTVISFQAV